MSFRYLFEKFELSFIEKTGRGIIHPPEHKDIVRNAEKKIQSKKNQEVNQEELRETCEHTLDELTHQLEERKELKQKYYHEHHTYSDAQIKTVMQLEQEEYTKTQREFLEKQEELKKAREAENTGFSEGSRPVGESDKELTDTPVYAPDGHEILKDTPTDQQIKKVKEIRKNFNNRLDEIKNNANPEFGETFSRYLMAVESMLGSLADMNITKLDLEQDGYLSGFLEFINNSVTTAIGYTPTENIKIQDERHFPTLVKMLNDAAPTPPEPTHKPPSKPTYKP